MCDARCLSNEYYDQNVKCARDEIMCAIDWHGTSLNNEHHSDHEVVRVEYSEQCGCFLMRDERRGNFCKNWFRIK